jgi:hypothetical protein
MTDTDYTEKLDELDRLLNDPDAPMQPERVWTLLAEISEHDLPHPGAATA